MDAFHRLRYRDPLVEVTGPLSPPFGSESTVGFPVTEPQSDEHESATAAEEAREMYQLPPLRLEPPSISPASPAFLSLENDIFVSNFLPEALFLQFLLPFQIGKSTK